MANRKKSNLKVQTVVIRSSLEVLLWLLSLSAKCVRRLIRDKKEKREEGKKGEKEKRKRRGEIANSRRWAFYSVDFVSRPGVDNHLNGKTIKTDECSLLLY
jgi:hypothetical protein